MKFNTISLILFVFFKRNLQIYFSTFFYFSLFFICSISLIRNVILKTTQIVAFLTPKRQIYDSNFFCRVEIGTLCVFYGVGEILSIGSTTAQEERIFQEKCCCGGCCSAFSKRNGAAAAVAVPFFKIPRRPIWFSHHV